VDGGVEGKEREREWASRELETSEAIETFCKLVGSEQPPFAAHQFSSPADKAKLVKALKKAHRPGIDADGVADCSKVECPESKNILMPCFLDVSPGNWMQVMGTATEKEGLPALRTAVRAIATDFPDKAMPWEHDGPEELKSNLGKFTFHVTSDTLLAGGFETKPYEQMCGTDEYGSGLHEKNCEKVIRVSKDELPEILGLLERLIANHVRRVAQVRRNAAFPGAV